MDIERPMRKHGVEILEPFFVCFEEVLMKSPSGQPVRADVIAITTSDCSSPIVIAVEVKSHQNTNPGKFKAALFQASAYVNAKIDDPRLRRHNGSSIDAAMVFPAPSYRWHGRISETDGLEYILTGIAFFAERLNVGRLAQLENDWEIVFGPNEFWSKRKGWMGHAKTRFPDRGIVTAFEKDVSNHAANL